MHFEQLYLACLSQASYLIVDEKTKTAVVVDPRRDVDVYLDKAAKLGARIEHVLLTHFHADFLAGHLELAERTGAKIWLGARGKAQYPCEPMQDGGMVELGDVRLVFLETPGHTPESVCVLVYDLTKDRTKPLAVLTGDTLFLGDVGRPDLMVAAGMRPEELAGMLYDSLRAKILPLPDATTVYPGHGAGSACGKSLSSDTSGPLGVQKRTNWALQALSREEFVRQLVTALPPAPRYFAHDARLNRERHATLSEVLPNALKPLALEEALALVNAGAQFLDTRDADSFAREHLVGAVNIGLTGRFASWVGTMLDPARGIVLLTEPGKEEESVTRLGRIGFDRVHGFVRGGIAAARGRTTSHARVRHEELKRRLAAPEPPHVLDIRTPSEWQAGHIDGAQHLVLDDLPARLAEIPRARELVIVCKSGYRSSIATSLLEKAGFTRVTDLAGGMDAWSAAAAGACANG
jgi:glyoxylase-like metal-dependent hydrolase (beta-lactamase superfamily II)/rhodanese-related sulfurtransferase